MDKTILGIVLFFVLIIAGMGYGFYWAQQQSYPTIQEQFDFIEGTIVSITHTIDANQDNTYVTFEDGSQYVLFGIVQGLKVGGTYRIYYEQHYSTEPYHVKLVEEL